MIGPLAFRIAGAVAALALSLSAGPAMASHTPSARSTAAGVSPSRENGSLAYGSLAGVTCLNTERCIAVGELYATAAHPVQTLTEKWNGSSWKLRSSPNPPGAAAAQLSAVACVSAGDCLAVGSYVTASRTTLPLAEEWRGTSWSLLTVPAPAGSTDTSLSGITCSRAGTCWAVGAAAGDTLAERWNGSAWSIVPSANPKPGAPAALSGVACGSPDRCWAVGSTSPAAGSRPLFEDWRGTQWRIVNVPGRARGVLAGISCAGRLYCVAVGTSGRGSGLAWQWNGTEWSRTDLGPSGAKLFGVACGSSTACEAVGTVSNGPGDYIALGLGWDGTGWSEQSFGVSLGEPYVSGQGVACPAADYCEAVGIFQGDVNTPLLAQWDGRNWTLQQQG